MKNLILFSIIVSSASVGVSADTDVNPAAHVGIFRTTDCTIGVASGTVTVDGRPLLWKVRDTSSNYREHVSYQATSPYSYLAVHGIGELIYMGLNEAGLATGNSSVFSPGSGNSNSAAQRHILQNDDSVDGVREELTLKVEQGLCNATGCFPFIDALGHAVIFEVSRSNWILEYDALAPGREDQGVAGFVVRANEFHQQLDGTDDISIGYGRYESGTYNVAGLIRENALSVQAIIQGSDGPNQGCEFVRYGPGRILESISRPTNRSTIVVHGVAPGEDPALATMWVILGHSNYGIAVPVWVSVSDIPTCLHNGQMFDRTESLYAKGNETATQASVFPMEAHFFDVVLNRCLPLWRSAGVPAVAELARIEHGIAADAYSLMDCLDNHQADNQPPQISVELIVEGQTVHATANAFDPDGNVGSVLWDFGDGQWSADVSTSHVYAATGRYLISCTAIDDDAVSVTDWRYVTLALTGAN